MGTPGVADVFAFIAGALTGSGVMERQLEVQPAGPSAVSVSQTEW